VSGLRLAGYEPALKWDVPHPRLGINMLIAPHAGARRDQLMASSAGIVEKEKQTMTWARLR